MLTVKATLKRAMSSEARKTHDTRVFSDGKYPFYESSKHDDVMNIYWVDAKIFDEFRRE